MAINPATEYVNIEAPTAAYPYGSAKESTSKTSKDGTPIDKPMLDDILGFHQALLSAASIVPSGAADSVTASQYLEALQALFATAAQGALADTALQPGGVFYVGEIRQFAFNEVPTLWLELGQAVSRATYAALFAEIGILWGPGNGTTTFDLPPKGYFLRSGPIANVGEIVEDSIKAHTHTVGLQVNGEGADGAEGGNGGSAGSLTSGSTGGTETAPKHIIILECIYAGV